MLRALQTLLARIYDVPQTHDVSEFLLTDRNRLPEALRASAPDELVVVAEERGTLWLSLYLEPGVLRRLGSADPFHALHSGNIADYWTVLEGVSHFMCLAWHAAHGRPVTLLELELQAEIDKYVSSLWLLRGQSPGRFPVELHPRLFRQSRVDAGLAGERVELYERANAYAARFCRRLARTLRQAGAAAHATAMAELRRFYRLYNGGKMRHIERFA